MKILKQLFGLSGKFFGMIWFYCRLLDSLIMNLCWRISHKTEIVYGKDCFDLAKIFARLMPLSLVIFLALIILDGRNTAQAITVFSFTVLMQIMLSQEFVRLLTDIQKRYESLYKKGLNEMNPLLFSLVIPRLAFLSAFLIYVFGGSKLLAFWMLTYFLSITFMSCTPLPPNSQKISEPKIGKLCLAFKRN